MELEFGHGFIPRIGKDNYKAVDRCIGPADMFTELTLDLPWAIVDGAWAESKPELIDTLKANGTRLLIDTFGWRYRYEATGEIGKLIQASWAPAGPVNLTDKLQCRELVLASLRAQAALGAEAYLLSGWMPDNDTEDLRSAYEVAFEVAAEADDIPARQFVAFIGGHTKGLQQLTTLLDEVPHFISAIYVQLSPMKPISDSPSKLESITDVYQYAASRGFRVIAGHADAITPALRALGIDAADAGLATNEAFDRASARRIAKPRPPGTSQGGGTRPRIYFSQLGRSFSASEVERLLEVPAAAAELHGCRLPCHRFRSGNFLDRAREHSLWARVQEAELVSTLPGSMRLTRVYESIRGQRSAITTINGSLAQEGLDLLDLKSIDNRLTWVSRAKASRTAA
jgi:hypothetical protein